MGITVDHVAGYHTPAVLFRGWPDTESECVRCVTNAMHTLGEARTGGRGTGCHAATSHSCPGGVCLKLPTRRFRCLTASTVRCDLPACPTGLEGEGETQRETPLLRPRRGRDPGGRLSSGHSPRARTIESICKISARRDRQLAEYRMT